MLTQEEPAKGVLVKTGNTLLQGFMGIVRGLRGKLEEKSGCLPAPHTPTTQVHVCVYTHLHVHATLPSWPICTLEWSQQLPQNGEKQ